VKLGILYGVSVGTGDPELITIKGLKILQQVSVVAFPEGVNGKLGMAQQTVSPWLLPKQKQLSLHFPYIQDNNILQQSWTKAAQIVWEYLKQGEDVAFACEGDVSFYSTFTYLAQTLQQLEPKIQIKIIPGVCSPCSAASLLGIPLTIKNEKLVILPALYNLSELEQILQWADVIVLLKVSSVYEQVWQLLAQYQLLEKSYLVEKATLPEQKLYQNLSQFPHLKLSYFSILIIKK
jgi:precorrin-2/cobalt-factor-2 C20-methyltransferase